MDKYLAREIDGLLVISNDDGTYSFSHNKRKFKKATLEKYKFKAVNENLLPELNSLRQLYYDQVINYNKS